MIKEISIIINAVFLLLLGMKAVILNPVKASNPKILVKA
jgi:hypothetical protein